MSGSVVEQAGDGEVHAVGRRAVDEQEAVGRAAHRQRPVERQRIRRAAAVALRRDHGDLGQRRQRRGEMLDARGEVAVVVGEEDAHRGSGRRRRKAVPAAGSIITAGPAAARPDRRVRRDSRRPAHRLRDLTAAGRRSDGGSRAEYNRPMRSLRTRFVPSRRAAVASTHRSCRRPLAAGGGWSPPPACCRRLPRCPCSPSSPPASPAAASRRGRTSPQRCCPATSATRCCWSRWWVPASPSAGR